MKSYARLFLIVLAVLVILSIVVAFRRSREMHTEPIYVDRTYYDTHQPQSGDLVSVEIPVGDDPRLLGVVESLSERFGQQNITSLRQIRRVVACSGDRVECREGILHVNGNALMPRDPLSLEADRDNWEPITVPANSVFVISDGLSPKTIDSRYYGCLGIGSIRGRVWMQSALRDSSR